MLTAFGVFQGMRAAAEVTWGAPTLHGRTVGVAGVGKVGHHLVTHLVDDGADVVVTDVDPAAVSRVQADHPQVRAVADTTELVRSELDVYAPCALGGALTDEVVEVLTARIVGAADGRDLVSLRETAKDETEIIGALDRLSKRLRERVAGEYLLPSLPARRRTAVDRNFLLERRHLEFAHGGQAARDRGPQAQLPGVQRSVHLGSGVTAFPKIALEALDQELAAHVVAA